MAFVFNRTDIFSAGGWIPVNKALAKAVGLDAAVIYGEMTRKEEYFKNHGMTINGGWFYVTEHDLEESTTLKRSKQDKAIAALIKAGMIQKKTMGLPAKRYFKIKDDGLNFTPPTDPGNGQADKDVENQQTDNGAGFEYQNSPKTGSNLHSNQDVENQQTGMTKINKLESRNSTRNNNNLNNNKLNNNNTISLNSSSSLNKDIYKEKKEEESENEPINYFTKQFLKDDLHYSDFVVNKIEKEMQENGLHTLTKPQMLKQDTQMQLWQKKNGKIVDWAKFFVKGILMAGESHIGTENRSMTNYKGNEEKRSTGQNMSISNDFNPIQVFKNMMVKGA